MNRLFLSAILGLCISVQALFSAPLTPPEIIARSGIRGTTLVVGGTNQYRFLPMLNSNGLLDASFISGLVVLDSNGVSQAQFIAGTNAVLNDAKLYYDTQITNASSPWISATNYLVQTELFSDRVRIGVLESQTQTWNTIFLIPSITNTLQQLVLYTNANNIRVASIASSNATAFAILGTITAQTSLWNSATSSVQFDLATNASIAASKSFTLSTSNALYTLMLQSNSDIWAAMSVFSTNGGTVTYASLTNTLARGFTVTNFTVGNLLTVDTISVTTLGATAVNASNVTLTGFLYAPNTTATLGTILTSGGTIGANPATMTQLWGATGALWTAFNAYTNSGVTGDYVTNAGTGLIKSGGTIYLDWPLAKATNDTFYSTLAQYSGVTNNVTALTSRTSAIEGRTNTWNSALQPAATNNLATLTYVNGATNAVFVSSTNAAIANIVARGYVTASITNGLGGGSGNITNAAKAILPMMGPTNLLAEVQISATGDFSSYTAYTAATVGSGFQYFNGLTFTGYPTNGISPDLYGGQTVVFQYVGPGYWRMRFSTIPTGGVTNVTDWLGGVFP